MSLEAEELGGVGVGGSLRRPYPQRNIAKHWTFLGGNSYLSARGGRWKRWKVKVESDGLLGCMSCTWRDMFFSSDTYITEEESLRGSRVKGDLRFQQEVHSWTSVSAQLRDPIGPWVPPKPQASSPHLPICCCHLFVHSRESQ